jgi:hypothetical protein
MDLKVFKQIYQLQKQYVGTPQPRYVSMKEQLDAIDEQIRNGGDRETLEAQKASLLETFV